MSTAESSALDVSQLLYLLPRSRISQTTLLCGLVLTTTFVSVYVITWISFLSRRASKESVKIPPTMPYMIPFIGSGISFALNPGRCLSESSQKAGPQAVYGLKILNKTLYFLYKPEDVAGIWKYKLPITTPNVTTFVLKTLFGMDFKALNMYTVDTSGILPKPKPEANVAPHNRIDYLTHASFHKYMLGEGLPALYQRFSASFLGRLRSLKIQDDWTDFPDMMAFWMLPLTASMNEALVGPVLESMNPNFTRDLLKYYPYFQDLMIGFPRWYIPEAYRLRRNLIQDIKQWHAKARERFRETDIGEDGGADPWWGSAFVRERQKMLTKVDNWDCDSLASSDFGLLWGASVNVHPMAIWTIIEVFRDRTLLSRVRAELVAANYQGIQSSQDMDTLLSLPLLQSVYAETLRLRVEVQTIFTSDQEDICINEWRFPKNSLVIVPAGAAHRNPCFWNTNNGEFPVSEFWADRFLAYPNEAQKNSRQNAANGCDFREKASYTTSERAKPKFVTSGLANSYMPYGVGERMCPGRGFARREIIAFCALMVDRFDIEIVPTKKEFELNPLFYGIGTQRPLRSIPFKIRKRRSQ